MKNSVKIDEEVKLWLDAKKIHPRQSYNEVLMLMMNKEFHQSTGMKLSNVFRKDK